MKNISQILLIALILSSTIVAEDTKVQKTVSAPVAESGTWGGYIWCGFLAFIVIGAPILKDMSTRQRNEEIRDANRELQNTSMKFAGVTVALAAVGAAATTGWRAWRGR